GRSPTSSSRWACPDRRPLRAVSRSVPALARCPAVDALRHRGALPVGALGVDRAAHGTDGGGGGLGGKLCELAGKRQLALGGQRGRAVGEAASTPGEAGELGGQGG